MLDLFDIPSIGIVESLVDEKVAKTGDTMTGKLTLDGAPTQDLHASTKKYVDDGLATKKNTGTFDTKIQNSTGNTAVSCDGDRYISIRSNGSKLADVLEDEQNAGMTILTAGSKRFNVVSGGPQTLYHNSPAGLFNLKYTDDGNTTPGQARFG